MLFSALLQDCIFNKIHLKAREEYSRHVTIVMFSACFLFIILQDLENYILELIPTLPQLDGLEKSFYSFYVCTAVRKFFFFLDPLRTGRSLKMLPRKLLVFSKQYVVVLVGFCSALKIIQEPLKTMALYCGLIIYFYS